MVGIVYATRREAEPFLSKLAADPLTGQPFSTFRKTGAGHRPFIAIISGMGKVAAAIAATHLAAVHRVSRLVNAGLCGRLRMDHGWLVGDLFRICTAVEGDCDRFGQAEQTVAGDARWFRQFKAARLVTQDRPVFDAARRGQLAGIGDLADMEGAAVARVAGLYGIPCAMIKGISDSADENGRQDVADRIDWVSGRIADALAHELSIKPTDNRHET
jgi:adenosylhomocysteine nucleosidase